MTTYKEAGVDIQAGDELVQRLKAFCPDIGGFGGLYPVGDNYLVAGADGVGTKLKLAFEMDIHDTVGIDLVAMNVNDILTCGAKPLFFLDYFSTSSLNVDQAEQVLKGIMAGCREAECALLGGETAEMPGFYQPKEYDLAGFSVGMVKKEELIDGSSVVEGNVVVGIPSSGFHSNGFSLVRRVLEKAGVQLHDSFSSDVSVGETLLTPTRIYVKEILDLIKKHRIKAMAHITGGGLPENTCRSFPQGLGACLQKGSWEIPAIFHWLQNLGNVDEQEMFRTFNMGIGMVLVVEKKVAEVLCENSELKMIGTVIQGEGVTWS